MRRILQCFLSSYLIILACSVFAQVLHVLRTVSAGCFAASSHSDRAHVRRKAMRMRRVLVKKCPGMIVPFVLSVPALRRLVPIATFSSLDVHRSWCRRNCKLSSVTWSPEFGSKVTLQYPNTFAAGATVSEDDSVIINLKASCDVASVAHASITFLSKTSSRGKVVTLKKGDDKQTLKGRVKVGEIKAVVRFPSTPYAKGESGSHAVKMLIVSFSRSVHLRVTWCCVFTKA
jgi:hypothetical protein